VIGVVEQVSGKKVPWKLGPRRPGDPAVLYADPQKAQTALHWKPNFADLESIVATAWRWHDRHPHGYGATTSS
jgi:UDP-glucose 4-epimerase